MHVTHNPNPSSLALLKCASFKTSGDILNVPACEKTSSLKPHSTHKKTYQ